MTALTLTRLEAAAKFSGFDGWLRRGIVPPPIPGTRRWSLVQLERALAGLPWVPADNAEGPEDAFLKWEREQGAATGDALGKVSARST